MSTIVGDSTARGGHAFHPAITKPPATDDNDGEDDNDDGVDNTPIDPSAVQAVVASALATASLTASSQFPTDTLLSCPLSSTLVDSLDPSLAMDIDPVPETMSNHPLTVSPPASISGVHKRKIWSLPHSAPPSVVSIVPSAPSAPSSFSPSSSTHRQALR